MTEKMTALLPRYTPLLLLAVAWEALTLSGIVPTTALPRLDTVATAWFGLAETGELWANAVASISRGASGLALAIAAGHPRPGVGAFVEAPRVGDDPRGLVFYPGAPTSADPAAGVGGR